MPRLLEIEEKMKATREMIDRVRSLNDGFELTLLDELELRSLEARAQQLENERCECSEDNAE